MKIIIDSYAWIEYLEGKISGQKVNDILKKENEIYTLNLTISEIVSRVKRKGGNSELAYNAIISNSRIINVPPKLAKEAGLLHAEIKKKIKDFGLMDSIILASARELGAKIITGDTHFKGFKETIFIG